MSELFKSHFSLSQFTQAKSSKKQARKTVGITEQSLTSILEYLSQQNTSESSKFLTVGSFLLRNSLGR
jgi:hypothetical protein